MEEIKQDKDIWEKDKIHNSDTKFDSETETKENQQEINSTLINNESSEKSGDTETNEIVNSKFESKDKISNSEEIKQCDELNDKNKHDSSNIKQCDESEIKNKPENSENVRLEGSQYIYTDPTTKSEYIWSEQFSKWVPRHSVPVFDGKNYTYKDDSGTVYKWDVHNNSWEKQEVYGFDGVNHTYTDPSDNTVYIWDKEKNAWFPKVDEDFLANYQMNYGFVEHKQEEVKEVQKKPDAPKRKADEPNWFDVDDQHNTKVYVSNLPLDVTEQEFVDLMQKCGLVMKDVSTNKWKIKLYTDSNNQLKGDALCTYFKRESVDLALKILDGYQFKNNKIKVEIAKFEMKGEFNPSLKPKKKRKKEKEKEKKIQEKLFDWRPDKLRGERPNNERSVIVKNLFDPKIFDKKMDLILEYTQDLREECQKCGAVKKVIIYDKHPDGVAQVTFSDAEEADICIKLLNNRWFGQRRITAETWDGKTKYKVVETEEEKKQRMEQWSKFLENEQNK